MPTWRKLLLGVSTVLAVATSVAAKPVDEQALHAVLVERVDVRKWGTAIVVGVSSPQGRRVVAYGPPAETFTPSILHATFGGELLIVQAGDHSHVHGGGHHGPAEQ